VLNGQVGFSIVDAEGSSALSNYDGSQVLPYTGTYFIWIHGWWGTPAPYTVEVKSVTDREGDLPDAVPMTIGEPISGSTDYYNDIDGFAFAAEAGQMYKFLGVASQPSRDLYLFVIDDDGNRLSGTYQPWVEWAAPADGTYHLQLGNWYGPTPYTIFSNVQRISDAAAAGVAEPLKSGEAAQGRVEAGESKYFAFHATANATYRLDVGGTAGDGVLVGLIGPDGTTAVRQLSWPWTAQQDGIYYLWVRSYNPVSWDTFAIQLGEDLDDHGNSAIEATRGLMGVGSAGTTQYWQDEDWFAFEVMKDQDYVFNLEGHGTVDPPQFVRRRKNHNPELTFTLFDENGQELAQRTVYVWSNLKVEWKAQSSGVVYAVVQANGDRDSYTLLAARTQDDPTPAMPLEAGRTDAGEIFQDMQTVRYRFEAEAGKQYVLTDSVGDASIGIVPADGNDAHDPEWICIDDDCEEVAWQAPVSGAYFVEVSSWWSAPLSYSIQISPHEAPVKRPREAGPEAAPILSKSNVLEDENDVRVYSFSAKKGSLYSFQTNLVTLEDSTLTLYDSDGQYIDENDDVSDEDYSSMLEWTAEKDGIYFIVVGGFGGGSFELSAYEGNEAQGKQLKLEELAVADGRMMFAPDTSGDEDGEEQSDAGWLSDDEEELDFGDEVGWDLSI